MLSLRTFYLIYTYSLAPDFSDRLTPFDFSHHHPFRKPLYKCTTPPTTNHTLPHCSSNTLRLHVGLYLSASLSLPLQTSPPLNSLLLLKQLHGDKSLVVTKADKGDAVIVLDMHQYLNLAYHHLSDPQTYRG